MRPDKPLTIKELPVGERPREKMLVHGPQFMSDAELLAILIRTGTRNDSAVRLAERILKDYDGLSGLGRLSPREIARVKGVGQAKAVSVIAAVELGKRISSLQPSERPVVKSPHDVANIMMPQLRYKEKEHFIAMLLSTKNHLLAAPAVSVGTLNASVVHARELFREAIQHSAASVILVHNHPSGDPAPSREDIALTKKLVEAGSVLDIPVLDHVIIGDGKYVSLKEKGII